jgi:hypothetical protein
MRLRVMVVYEAGRGAFDDVEKFDEGFVDGDLERCVLSAIRDARWETTMPDDTVGFEQTLYVGMLMARDANEAPTGLPPAASPPLPIPMPPRDSLPAFRTPPPLPSE